MQSAKKVIDIDNPGRGNCGFYAFANGLIPILQREIISGKKTRINKIVNFIEDIDFGWPTFESDIAAIKDFKSEIYKVALEKFNLLLRIILVSSQRRFIEEGLKNDARLDNESRVENNAKIKAAEKLIKSSQQAFKDSQEKLQAFVGSEQEREVLEDKLIRDDLAATEAHDQYIQVISSHPKELSFRGVSGDSLMADVFGVFECYLSGKKNQFLNTDVARSKELSGVIKATVKELKSLSVVSDDQKPRLKKQKDTLQFTTEQMYNHLVIRLLHDKFPEEQEEIVEIEDDSAEKKPGEDVLPEKASGDKVVVNNHNPVEEKEAVDVAYTALKFNPDSAMGRFILIKLQDGELATQQDLTYLANFFDIHLDVYINNASRPAQGKPDSSTDTRPVISVRNIGNRHWTTRFSVYDPNWVTLLLLQQDKLDQKLVAALSVDTIQSRAFSQTLYLLMKNNVISKPDDHPLLMKSAPSLDDDEKAVDNKKQKKKTKPSFMRASAYTEAIKRLSWFGLVNQANDAKLIEDPALIQRIVEMREKQFKEIYLYFYQNSENLSHIAPMDIFLWQEDDDNIMPRLKLEAYIGNCRRVPTSFLARFSSSEKVAVASQLIVFYLHNDPSVVFTERDIKILRKTDLFKLVTELDLPIPQVNAARPNDAPQPGLQ